MNESVGLTEASKIAFSVLVGTVFGFQLLGISNWGLVVPCQLGSANKGETNRSSGIRNLITTSIKDEILH